MNIVFVKWLIIAAALVPLLGVRVFKRKLINVATFAIIGGLISLFILKLFSLFFHHQNTLLSLCIYPIFVIISIYVYGIDKRKSTPRKGEAVFELGSDSGTIEFYYPRDNFLVFGGAGSGKTASIGKPLLEQFIKNGWAGFIYDYKDFDYTKTAYNLIQKYGYPYTYYQVSFTDMSRTNRFNVLKKEVIDSESLLFQVMDDFLRAMLPVDAKTDEWYNGALGLLKGVASRFYSFKGEYEKYCTLPHILNFILLADSEQLISFLEGDLMSKRVAGAFLGARSSERTRDSYLSTLNNYITNLATNKNVCYVLTGDDFIFNLTDPNDPKLFAISNNFALESLISPIVAMLVPIAARKIEFGNKVKFAFVLDEMTTFKVNNFQNMPSVLREYGAAFLIMTQSGSKLEKVYGKNDRASIEANCANIFLGRTKDVEALKYYPLFFGKVEKEKQSYSAGSSSGRYNSSVTRSKQKEEVYDTNTFAELQQGEFILSAGESNVKRLKTRFKMFNLEEKPLPIIRLTTEREINKNYDQIGIDCEKLLEDFCGRS
jgi:hypothetical protein